EQTMCCGRVARSVDLEVIELPGERAEDLPRAIGRDVVDDVDTVAELNDVPDRLLDEHVLVSDEDAADDSRHRSSSESRRCSMLSSWRWARTAYASLSPAASTAYAASSAAVGTGNDSGSARSDGSAKLRPPPSTRSSLSASLSRVSIASVPAPTPRA